jgi:hypothetical protein
MKCSWSGDFRYKTNSNGHEWVYANPKKWLVLKSDGKELSFRDIAQKLKSRKGDIEALVKELTGTESLPWILTDWLGSAEELPTETSDKAVGRGLSVVLNAIIKNSTLQPFQILSSFVNEHVTVEIRGLGEGIPNWFYLRDKTLTELEGYLFGMPNLFFSSGDPMKFSLRRNIKATLSHLACVRVLHKYSIIGFQKDDRQGYIDVSLRDDFVGCEYLKGKLCACIPLPGKRRKQTQDISEPEEVNSPEVVVGSPIVASALVSLSRIWQDPFVKSILISAPPGSGKEVLATSIPFGNGRPTENLQTLAMTDPNQHAILRQLYGFIRSDGSIEPGLIAQARNSALFLDEIHQPCKKSAARVSLLRPLESDEFYPIGSGRPQKVQNVLFIMATSRTINELAEYEPPDFWTRMTYAIQINHPLALAREGQETLIADVLIYFFNYFWWERLEKYYGISPTSRRLNKDDSSILRYWQMRSMMQVINVDANNADSKAQHFSAVILNELERFALSPEQFSIRGIRSIVTRLFSIAASNVSQGLNPWNTTAKQNELEAFDSDTKIVFREIRKVADLKK